MSREAAKLPWIGKGDCSTVLGVLMSQIIRRVRAMHGRVARLILSVHKLQWEEQRRPIIYASSIS